MDHFKVWVYEFTESSIAKALAARHGVEIMRLEVSESSPKRYIAKVRNFDDQPGHGAVGHGTSVYGAVMKAIRFVKVCDALLG